MQLTRRAALYAATATFATAVGGCTWLESITGTTTPSAAFQALLSDASNIVNGVAAEATELAAVIPATVMATINADIAAAKVALATLEGLTNIASATTVVQAIETAISDAIQIAMTYTLPAMVTTVLQAAQVLLPIIASAVGLDKGPVIGHAILSEPPASMSPAVARVILGHASLFAPRASMSPFEARVLLSVAAAHH